MVQKCRAGGLNGCQESDAENKGFIISGDWYCSKSCANEACLELSEGDWCPFPDHCSAPSPETIAYCKEENYWRNQR